MNGRVGVGLAFCALPVLAIGEGNSDLQSDLSDEIELLRASGVIDELVDTYTLADYGGTALE